MASIVILTCVYLTDRYQSRREKKKAAAASALALASSDNHHHININEKTPLSSSSSFAAAPPPPAYTEVDGGRGARKGSGIVEEKNAVAGVNVREEHPALRARGSSASLRREGAGYDSGAETEGGEEEEGRKKSL